VSSARPEPGKNSYAVSCLWQASNNQRCERNGPIQAHLRTGVCVTLSLRWMEKKNSRDGWP
jgi:hypothetical protein